MKWLFWWVVLNGGFATAVWFGFIEGVEGAQFVAKFFVWSVAPLGALMALSIDSHKRLAAQRDRPASLRLVSKGIALFALDVFVWTGNIATAIAWGFWMLCGALVRQGVAEQRAAAAKAGS